MTHLQWLRLENVKLEQVELRVHLQSVHWFILNHVIWPANTKLSNVRGFLPTDCNMWNDGEQIEMPGHSPQLPSTDLRWERFAVNAGNKNTDFEILCSKLCKLEYFDRNTLFPAVPNNPGVEWHPKVALKGEFKGKRIGMQAKYFEGNLENGYKEIFDSASNAVKYYHKGRASNDVIEVFLLFCNKKLSQSDESGTYKNNTKFRDTKQLLNNAGIQLQVIDEQDLLDRIGKYPELQVDFFHRG